MHYLHTLYIDAAPVAEIEIQVKPFLTWGDELALELSVTDVDGQEHEIQDPELLSIILAKHRCDLWGMAVEKHRECPQSSNNNQPYRFK
jgi:hypothetical protein